MNLKSRISKTGTLLVLSALIALFLMGGLLMFFFSTRTHSLPYVAMDQNIEQAELLLHENVFPEDMAEALHAYDYQLYIVQGEKVIFSNAEDSAERVADAAIQSGWSGRDGQYLLIDGVSMVGIHRDDAIWIALHDTPTEIDGLSLTETFLISYLLLSLLLIGLIVSAHHRLSSQLIHKLLMPIDELTDAAHRIGSGDFTQPVRGEADPALQPVVDAFNNMQENLLASQKKNLAYEKARTDLVAGISHDLRTPLTAVKGYIKGLQDGIANTPEKQARYLDVAYRRATDMEALLHRLFFFSKMETGNIIINKQNVDLEELLTEYVSECNREMVPRHAQITLDCSDGPHMIPLDAEHMTRILNNLMENALKYAQPSATAKAAALHGAESFVPAATPTLQIQLTLRKEADGEHLIFSDNGLGVPDGELPQLFDEFWRGDESRSQRRGEGSGLGLFIVKYLVEAHGGRVHAYNDHGLTIEMVFPITSDQTVFW